MKTIQEKEFSSEIENQNIVIQFSANWCGPCRVLTPVLEKVANNKNINVVKVNIDEAPGLVQNYKIRSVPSILFIKQGTIDELVIGNKSKDALEKLFDKIYG